MVSKARELDACVPTLACYYAFNSRHPFSIDDQKGKSEGSGPGICTRYKDALGREG